MSEEFTTIFGVLLIDLLFAPLKSTTLTWLILEERSRTITLRGIRISLIRIVGYLIFIPLFGSVGTALSFLAPSLLVSPIDSYFLM